MNNICILRVKKNNNMTQLRGKDLELFLKLYSVFLRRLWCSQTQAPVQVLTGPWRSSELIQRDVVWDESAPRVPGVLPSLSLFPDCHHCVLGTVTLGLRGFGHAGVVCSPAWPQVPHKATLAHRINMEAQMLVYSRWICLPALSYGSWGEESWQFCGAVIFHFVIM